MTDPSNPLCLGRIRKRNDVRLFGRLRGAEGIGNYDYQVVPMLLHP